MATATEEWSKRKYVQNQNVQRTFRVIQASNEQAALDAVDAAFGVHGGVTPSTHPLNSNMYVDQMQVAYASFNVLDVQATYAWGVRPNNALNVEPRITVRPSSISTAFDEDRDGNPIVNAAGDAFSPSPSADFPIINITISRPQSRYDLVQAMAYRDKINQNAFNLLGQGMVQPGQARCVVIAPKSDFTKIDKIVWVDYNFELLPGRRQDSKGIWNGFKIRELNQGKNAWYTDPNTNLPAIAKISYADPEVKLVSEDVRLDKTGKPMNDKYKVGKGYYDPIANPTTPPGADFDDSNDKAVWVEYWAHGRSLIDFTGLDLF